VGLYHGYADLDARDQPGWFERQCALLKDDRRLLRELRDAILTYCREWGQFWMVEMPRELAYYDANLQVEIRDRVWRMLRKLEASGCLQMSHIDKSDDTQYRQLTPLGSYLLQGDGFEHVVLGPAFTLQTKRPAMRLVVLDDGGESGTAVHAGGGSYLTCAHCVPEGKRAHLIDVRDPDVVVSAKVLRRDDVVDVARVEGDEADTSVTLAASPPETLDPVLILHFPNVPALERALISTTGEVNGRAANILRRGYEDLLVSAKTAPGSSGGALINGYGELAGIVVGSGASVSSTGASPDEATWRGEPFYHAIPIDQIRSALF